MSPEKSVRQIFSEGGWRIPIAVGMLACAGLACDTSPPPTAPPGPAPTLTPKPTFEPPPTSTPRPMITQLCECRAIGPGQGFLGPWNGEMPNAVGGLGTTPILIGTEGIINSVFTWIELADDPTVYEAEFSCWTTISVEEGQEAPEACFQ
jgi:hypothetical protein